eukprot:tig00021723_g23240.t1
MGASYTITCSGANLTAYAGTVTGAAPDFTPGAASSTMSTNSSTAASLFAKSVGPPSVTVSSSGADAVLAAVSWNTTGASGTEPAYANVTVSCSSNGVADSASNATVASETGTGSATVLVSAGSGRWQVQSHVTSCAATVYYSYLGVASSATAYSTVHAKTVENVTVGTPIPQSTTSVTVPVSWALSAVGYSGDNVAPTYGPLEVSCSGAGVTRTGSLASGTITAGATSANHDEHELVDGSIAVRQVGGAAVGDGLVERGGRCFGAVSWNTTGASGTEPAYANVTVSCSSNGVADSASNATVASETGTGSATVLVSAGSGRWQVQSHVTSCAATVYYSYLGVASSATAYSTGAWGHGRHFFAVLGWRLTRGVGRSARKDGGERDGGDADPAVDDVGDGARELGALGGGYSGDNVAPTYGPLEVSCSGAGVTRTGSLASGTITAGATSANVTVLGLPEMGASYTITCSGANLTAYAGTVTGAAPDFTPGAASSTMSTNSSTAASLFGARGRGAGWSRGAAASRWALTPARSQVGGPPSVTVSSSGADAVLAAVSWNTTGASGTEPAYANVTVSCSSNGVADSASNATVASETGTGSATVLVSAGSGGGSARKDGGERDGGDADPAVDDVGDGELLRGRRDADGLPGERHDHGWGDERQRDRLGLPEMGASYTITCSGANLTAYAGTVTGAAPDFTPGAASSTMSTNSSTAASLFAKSVGPPSVTVSSSGADAVLAAVSWNTTGRRHGAGVRERDRELLEQRRGGLGLERDSGLGDGTGSATVLVSAGSGRWQVQSHVTSCAATVYYSYLGVASSATAYSTDGGERDGGDADPAVDDVGDGAVSWALSAVGYSGDNVAPTYGPLEVSCSGAGVTRTGSLASGTITAGATSANVTVLGLPEMGASYTITCSGANLTAYAGTVTGAAPDFTPGAASSTMSTNSSTAASLFAKSVGPPSVTVSSSGADAVLAAVSWNTTGASGTEPAYANVTVSCSSNGVADSASNATVASETGTGSATVLVSAGSGRWQVQSHVTSCAATVYYSYLGVASSATAYSTVHAKTVENVTVGTPIPQSTTSVTVPVSWALSAVGYSGDNVAPTYGPLE